MLTLTFQSARDNNACEANYQRFAKFKGGDTRWGMNKPFPVLEVLENNGFDDALWALRCCEPQEERDKLSRLFACDCAERVLPLFEKESPEDKRPRYAIEVSRRFANREATQSELAAARDAAEAAGWAAGWDAAWAAAEVAARVAAAVAARVAVWVAAGVAGRDAEREWQTQHLREVLSTKGE